MITLNLPEANFKIKKEGGKVSIFDNIRKKYVALTPEEWVRQHFVNYLIHHLGYPRALFRVESSLPFHNEQKRSDILIYNRDGNPWFLTECKSPFIKLSQNAFNQVSIYNMKVGAKYLCVTNGLVHYCYLFPSQGQKIVLLPDFPAFED